MIHCHGSLSSTVLIYCRVTTAVVARPFRAEMQSDGIREKENHVQVEDFLEIIGVTIS